MDIETVTPTQWIDNEKYFLKLLENPSIYHKIPLLNVNKTELFRNLSLVRFYGMIQDMHSPEYYLEKFEVINKSTNLKSSVFGKYQENVEVEDNYINFDSSSNVTSERQTFVVISVPALNNWVHTVENKFKIEFPKSVTGNNKRTHAETMDTTPGPSSDLLIEGSKKQCKKTSTSTNVKPSLSIPNDIFPLPNESNQVYHMKVYNDSDKLKINDVCEFIGFLDLQPTPIAEVTDEMDVDFSECPASFPKIHCVNFSKLKHNNPLLNQEILPKTENNFKMISKDLLVVLTQLFLGDELAAEYLLYNLLSNVYLRRDSMALGKFSLNISNIPIMQNLSYPHEVYKFIEKLVPKSHYLPMTLENLNDLSFVPKKNYDGDYLSSGVLQLSQNTHLVLDETKMSAGKLNEAGLSNIKALSSCIKDQILSYDFKFYPLEFECDIPFLILSEGKSMIHSDVHVVLQPDEMCLNNFKEIIEAAEHFLKPELLDDMRIYLTLTRMSEYVLTERIEEFVQNEMVKLRQNKNVTVDELHSILVLARLVSMSEGKSSLDEECWQKALNMEEKRKSRIKI